VERCLISLCAVDYLCVCVFVWLQRRDVQGVIVDVGAPKTAARCGADGAAQWTSCVDDALVCGVAVG
jgi:uncharacterized membrane protein